MMLSNGFWCYVGTPVPAGSTNDIGVLNTEWNSIKNLMERKKYCKRTQMKLI